MITEEISTELVYVNKENVNTNMVFLETLLNDIQIVAVQEHWLYDFEKGKLIMICDSKVKVKYIKNILWLVARTPLSFFDGRCSYLVWGQCTWLAL